MSDARISLNTQIDTSTKYVGGPLYVPPEDGPIYVPPSTQDTEEASIFSSLTNKTDKNNQQV